MRFCDVCDLTMTLTVQPGAAAALAYQCPLCLRVQPAAPEDLRILGGHSGTVGGALKYERAVSAAAHDPCTERRLRACPLCRLPYLAFVRLPETEQVIWTCTCGYRSNAPGAPPPGPPAQPGAPALTDAPASAPAGAPAPDAPAPEITG